MWVKAILHFSIYNLFVMLSPHHAEYMIVYSIYSTIYLFFTYYL